MLKFTNLNLKEIKTQPFYLVINANNIYYITLPDATNILEDCKSCFSMKVLKW